MPPNGQLQSATPIATTTFPPPPPLELLGHRGGDVEAVRPPGFADGVRGSLALASGWASVGQEGSTLGPQPPSAGRGGGCECGRKGCGCRAGPAPPRPEDGAPGTASWRGPGCHSYCRRGRSQRGHGLPRRPPRPKLAALHTVAPRRSGLDVTDSRAGSMEEAHLLSAADVLHRFSVTAEGGLSLEQVTDARERYGPNGERGSPPCGGERWSPS